MCERGIQNVYNFVLIRCSRHEHEKYCVNEIEIDEGERVSEFSKEAVV